jgi:hypothetical protein
MLSYHVQPVATAVVADDDEPEDGEIMSMDGEDVEDEVLECSSVCGARMVLLVWCSPRSPTCRLAPPLQSVQDMDADMSDTLGSDGAATPAKAHQSNVWRPACD